MTPGTVVTYICRDYEHTALVIDANGAGDTVRLVHVVSLLSGRSVPQIEVEVPRDVADAEGRFFRENI